MLHLLTKFAWKYTKFVLEELFLCSVQDVINNLLFSEFHTMSMQVTWKIKAWGCSFFFSTLLGEGGDGPTHAQTLASWNISFYDNHCELLSKWFSHVMSLYLKIWHEFLYICITIHPDATFPISAVSLDNSLTYVQLGGG